MTANKEVAAVAVAVVGLILSAVPVAGGDVTAAERTAFQWVNDLPDVPEAVPWVAMQVGNVFATVVVAIVAWRWRGRWLAASVAIAGAGVWVAAKAVKRVVPRGRPSAVLDEVTLRSGAAEGGYGWVSGHAAVTAAIVTVLWPDLTRTQRTAAVAVVAPMYLARVYVGDHFPLDMVGGAFFGVMVGTLVVVGRRRDRRAPAVGLSPLTAERCQGAR